MAINKTSFITIIERLLKLLTPPTYQDDYRTRQAATLVYLVYSLIVAATVGSIVAFWQGFRAEGWALGLGALVITAVAILVHSGQTKLASQLLPAVMLLVLLAMDASNILSIRSSTMQGVYTIIVMAALLLGQRGVIVYTASVLGIWTLIYVLEMSGVTRSPYAALGLMGFANLFEILVHTALTGIFAYVLVGNLTASRNQALAHEQQVRVLNNRLEQRVRERTRELEVARHEAEAARDAAIKADQIKSQFLASMSHELRTPLNAIINFTDVILMEILGPINNQQSEMLGRSLASSRHLLGLINDVLDITKIQSGMMKLLIEDKIDITAELKTVESTAQTILKDKPGVDFKLEADENLPTIRGDKRRIRQVLLNLVSNACKFTDEGSVTLRAERKMYTVLFAVIDTGPGISKTDQVIIFQPFVQSETGIVHAGGTGLGLPISQKLVEAHGGSLWVESEPGKGATFYAELPIFGPDTSTIMPRPTEVMSS